MAETTLYQHSLVDKMQNEQLDDIKHPKVTKALPPGRSSVSASADAACHRKPTNDDLLEPFRRRSDAPYREL